MRPGALTRHRRALPATAAAGLLAAAAVTAWYSPPHIFLTFGFTPEDEEKVKHVGETVTVWDTSTPLGTVVLATAALAAVFAAASYRQRPSRPIALGMAAWGAASFSLVLWRLVDPPSGYGDIDFAPTASLKANEIGGYLALTGAGLLVVAATWVGTRRTGSLRPGRQ